jgi:hypothetical protein
MSVIAGPFNLVLTYEYDGEQAANTDTDHRLHKLIRSYSL